MVTDTIDFNAPITFEEAAAIAGRSFNTIKHYANRTPGTSGYLVHDKQTTTRIALHNALLSLNRKKGSRPADVPPDYINPPGLTALPSFPVGYITMAAAAELLQISRQGVFDLVRKRKVNFLVSDTYGRLVEKASVEAYHARVHGSAS